MNLYDNPINIEDEDLILNIKSLDLRGLQKVAYLIDCIRALHRIHQQSWFYRQAIEHGDLNEPLVLGYKDTEKWLQQLSYLEFREFTPQAIACTLDIIDEHLNLVNSILEASVIESTVFTSRVQLARTLHPVLQCIKDCLEALYLESQYNIITRLDFNTSNSKLEHESIYLHDIKNHLNEMLKLVKKQDSTFVALMGVNILKLLNNSSKFFKSRGQTLMNELKDANNDFKIAGN